MISALRSDDKDETVALVYDTLSETTKAAVRKNDLGVISVLYIILGLVVLVIMIVILATKIPKTDEKDKIDLGASFKKLFANKNYVQGVVAQAFYVRAQIISFNT